MDKLEQRAVFPTGYTENKAAKAETGRTFVEIVGQKAVEADKEVKGRNADHVLDSIAEHAPEEVRQAFLEAEKETGGTLTVFGLWIFNDGKQAYMTQMGIDRFVRWYHGDFNQSDLLGTSVESAINAVKKLKRLRIRTYCKNPSSISFKRLNGHIADAVLLFGEVISNKEPLPWKDLPMHCNKEI